MQERGVSGFTDLIARARRGEQSALSQLYETYLPQALMAIRKRLSPSLRRKFDTLDLGHSVYIEVLRDLPGFEDRGEEAFRSWLAVKARSKVLQKYRRDLLRQGNRREVTLLGGMVRTRASGESSPVQRASGNEEVSSVHFAMAALDPGYRSVLRLRNEDALSFAEVAGWMDLPSAEAARKLYARALVKLRRTMMSVLRRP